MFVVMKCCVSAKVVMIKKICLRPQFPPKRVVLYQVQVNNLCVCVCMHTCIYMCGIKYVVLAFSFFLQVGESSH